MKAILASDCYNRYADLNKDFDIYTDSSDYQVGAAILQDGHPIAYFSKKLSQAQLSYSTTEKECLAIVLCLKEYRKMLYGGKLNIFTDHKNLTFKTLCIQRILRWRLFIDEFDVTLKYVPGKENILADCFSRLPRMDKPTEGKGSVTIAKKMERNGVLIDFANIKLPKDDNVFEDELYQEHECYAHIDEDNEIMECMLNLPSVTFESSPLSMENIRNHQQQSPALLELQRRNPVQFRNHTISNVPIITIAGTVPNQPTLWKIYLPETLIKSTLKWFHKTLGHCGTDQL